MEQIHITVDQAARLMKVSSRTIQRTICVGKLCAETVYGGAGQGGESYRIPLDALPAEAQIRYLEEVGRAERSERGYTEAFDLEMYKAHYGVAGVEKLLERQKAVLRLRGLRQTAEKDLTGAVNALAAEYGMSGATLRRLEGRYIEEGLQGLTRRGRNDKGESRSMCLGARRMICELDLDWNRLKANTILDMVKDRARELGPQGCKECPYNHDSENYGTTTATVEDGAKGDKGDPGSDASVTADNIKSALGYTPVKDVQVAGSSVLDGGVANVPIAQTWVSGAKQLGVLAPCIAYGLRAIDGLLQIYPAELENISNRVFDRPIVPPKLDYAVKSAMCDGKGAAWTAAEQKAARERMGVDKAYELIEEIILNESVTQVVRTNMSLAEMRIVVEVPVSDSTGAVAIEVYSGSGLIGYGYIGNFINKDNVKVAKFSVKRDRGAYVFSMVSTNANSASQKAGVGTLSETATLFQVENAITKISLYSTSSSILLPVGTKITIEGETI